MGTTVSEAKHALIRLRDMVSGIDSIDDELTIYAATSWTPDSLAIVRHEPEGGGEPPEAKALGMTYFLEVSIVKEVLEGIKNMDLEAKTRRIIQYAVSDA
jgi:hypothetical protein